MATLVQAEQELILRVARAYFDVLRSQEALTAFEAEVAAAASVLEHTQQRY
jgi:outer membrane protein